MRDRRIQLGMSQPQVAELIDVNPSEVHRWEKGERVISSARLHDIARALAVDVGYFFEKNGERMVNEHEQMALALSRNFAKITHPALAEAITHLVRALGEVSAELTSRTKR